MALGLANSVQATAAFTAEEAAELEKETLATLVQSSTAAETKSAEGLMGDLSWEGARFKKLDVK